MFESLPDAYFLLGKQGGIIDFNHTAYNAINGLYGKKLSYGRIMTGFMLIFAQHDLVKNPPCCNMHLSAAGTC